MEKINFRNLLTDLYNIYNPDNIQYIDDLLEKYNRHEFDALQNIFIKYNRKFTPYYDSEIGTDKYILNLIKEYDSGIRSLENVDLKKQVHEKTESIEKKNKQEENEKIETLQKEVKGEVDKKIQDIEKSFSEKENELKKALDNIYDNFEKKLSTLKNQNDDVTIRIFSTYTNSELDLPNKKIIAGLGRGSRLVLKDKENKVIGLEIFDIIYDDISSLDGKPLIEIFVQKI
jgi:seryl-tRNA synthetase